GPDSFDQFGLGERSRAVLDQQLQQLKGFGRKVDFLSAANEPPRVDVESAVAKRDRHAVLFKNSSTDRKDFQTRLPHTGGTPDRAARNPLPRTAFRWPRAGDQS